MLVEAVPTQLPLAFLNLLVVLVGIWQLRIIVILGLVGVELLWHGMVLLLREVRQKEIGLSWFHASIIFVLHLV